MRCRKCGEKAVINMRQHRLALCKEHFLEWLPEQTERFIRKYDMFSRTDRLLVAVSGGKDSLALWDVLWKLDYQADGLYIHLGIDQETGYSDRSEDCARKFALERNLKLLVVNVQGQFGESIPQIAARSRRGQGKVCSVCGLAKRHIFNQIAQAQGYSALLTAHNLDDEAAFLLSNTLDWSLPRLARGFAVLPAAPGFARKVKPFCRFYERETAAYAILREIAYLPDECPYAIGSKQLFFKEDLNRWEAEMPGTKLRFYLNYLTALDEGVFPERQEEAEVLSGKLCSRCGQPTTAGELCAFCRMFEE